MVRRLDPGLIVAALLPLIGVLPTLGAGVIDTADGPLHVQRITAMGIMLQHGELWPRWVSWFHLGFGYPIFNFYPPGVFYLGGLLGGVGIPATIAFTIVAALAWVVGSVGMYRLAQLFLPAHAALLGALLWSYAPSRLFEVWDQGSLPQMLAAALVPWLFAGIIAAARQPSRRAALWVALPLAGIIFCHQPITFITALYAAPLAVIAPLWYARNQRETLIHRFGTVFGGLALGALLAGIFLLPLAAELRFVQASSGAEDTVDYLRSNFLLPSEIFAQPQPADLTDLRLELPTTLGLIGGLLALPGLVALARRRQYGLLALLLVGLGFTLFMLLEASLPVWLGIPLFRQLRFPERFLRIGAVLIALVSAASILWLPRRWQMAGVGAACVLVILLAMPLVYPNQPFLAWGRLTARDEINFEIAHYTWGTTSYDEFDPIWGEDIPLPLVVPEPEEYATNPLRLIVNRVDMARYGDIMQVEQIDDATTRVRLAQAHHVRFHQYYYPGWTATLDGQPAEIVPDEQFGLITVHAPEGEHVIRLEYVGTTAQHLGALVTLAALVVSAALFITGRKPAVAAQQESLAPLSIYYEVFFKDGEGPGEGLPTSTIIVIAASIIAFALVNTFVLTPNTLLFRHRSAPESPAYMRTPVHADFGGEFELLGYTLDQDSADPGGLFDITLFWKPQHEIERTYRPIVQLVNLPVTAAWGASEPFFPGGGQSIGYPPDRFASEVHELRVFETAPPYVARVLVQMIDVETGEPLRLPDGTDRLILEPMIRIVGSDEPLEDRLGVTIFGALALRCADVQVTDGGYQVNAYWHVLSEPEGDYAAFVHGLDADGEIVAQGDAPPLQGQYPTSLWLPEQNLSDHYTLPGDEPIEQVAFGFYRPEDGSRLPAANNGTPLPDDRVLIPVGGESCQP